MKSEWTDKMRDALEEYSEAEPDGLWEGISEGLAAKQAVRSRRLLWSVTGAAAAAVAAVLLLFGVSGEPASIPVEGGVAESLTTEKPAVTMSLREEEPVSSLLSDASGRDMKRPVRIPVIPDPASEAGDSSADASVSSEKEVTVSDDASAGSGPASGQATDKGTGDTRRQVEESDMDGVTLGWNIDEEETERPGRGRVSLSLSGDNIFQLSGAGSGSVTYGIERNTSDDAAYSFLFQDGQGLQADRTKVYVQYDDVTYSEGGVSTTSLAEISSEHRQPVRVGVNAAWQFHRRFRLESGLTYTWLKSDFKLSDGSDVRQTLHYLGLPLGVDFTLWGNDRWDVYLSAGGLMEKCIAGKRTTDGGLRSGGTRSSGSVMDGPLQWSLNGGAGVQVSLGKVFGLYVEPGAAYYFDNGSSVKNFYKEKPWSFNLRFGFRFIL